VVASLPGLRNARVSKQLEPLQLGSKVVHRQRGNRRRDGFLLEGEVLAVARSTMESLTLVATEALTRIVCKLKELQTAATRRCNVADENRAEQGIHLENMDGSGMRNRLASGQASGSTNDNPDSPSTTSGDSGTMTPGSDENLESQGMIAVYEVQHAR
jgi:hypothetical protein